MIKFVRLIDDDIVADVTENNDSLTLNKAARLVTSHQGIGMMPMNPFIKEDKVTIPKQFVMYTATPEDEILNAYNSKFGSGLVLAGSNLFSGAV